uniref:ORF70b n=1 Tax=Pinus koraiensis TaxID=88728 RepID=Q85WX4_PINKO|nr:ORF70b [Pinus koraiensis]
MVGTTNIHLVCTLDTLIMEPSEIVEVINPRRIQGVKNKEIVRGSIPSTKILGIWKRIFARRMVRYLLEIH